MSSILTNNNAMAALSTLRSISSGMEETQSRISSGLKVGTAADNAAYWSIATTMRSDNAALGSVQDAMGLGAAKIDTAYAGMEAAIDVVTEIKNKLVTAQESSADKSKIQEEIKQLQDQLKSISSSATFSGENFLQADVSNAANNEIVKSVVGSFTRDAGGNVKVQTVDYKLNASTVLFDTGAAAGAGKGILDATFKVEGKRTEVEITTNKPVTITGDALAKGNNTFTAAAGAVPDHYTTSGGDRYIRYNVEKFDADGESLGYSQALDANGKDLWVKVTTTAGAAPNDQLANAPSAAGATATVAGHYVVTEQVTEKVSVAASTEAALKAALKSSADPVAGHAGAGAGTGVYAAASGTFTGLTPATPAVPADDAANDLAIAAITAEDFKKVEVTNGVMTVYSQYTEDATTAGTFNAGKIEQYVKLGADDTWVKVLDGGDGTDADTDAGKAKAAGQQSITVDGDEYYIDANNTTLPGKVETDFAVSVSDLDITKLGDLAKATGFSEQDVLDQLVSSVDSQLSAMTSAASQLGSLSSRIDMQQEFVSKLSDTLDSGIGRLVDADMNEESTRLKALQTQQQLAIQALSIANSDSQNILSLFR